MPQVSVIIPTHNRPQLLARALSSVYDQTFTDFEVIVVDDGQSVKNHFFLASFWRMPNFQYIETTKNTGGAATRNLGIKTAKGEFITFLDDDDEWLPTKLEKQVEALKNSSEEVSLVYGGVAAYDETGLLLYRSVAKESGIIEPLPRLLYKCDIWTSALMYRRSYVERGFIFDAEQKKNQEWDLELRLGQVSKFYALAEALTRINIGESEQMGGKKNLPNIIAGYERFLNKHQDLYLAEPKAYALRLFHVGHLHWDNKNYLKAREYWLKAWRYHFFNLIYPKHYLVSLLGPAVYNRLTGKNIKYA
ncbi:MAG: glycosyltransferase family 2 protein [Candidatus Pacebacteria bacterium]|nr:glycosyltransferase family 2 protein [Candidatus Paceibacterota bacterium]